MGNKKETLRKILNYNCDNITGVVLHLTAEKMCGLYNSHKLMRELYDIDYRRLGKNSENRWQNLSDHLDNCDECRDWFEIRLDIVKTFLKSGRDLPKGYQWYH